MGIWDFIQQQFLGMRWLSDLVTAGLTATGLDVSGRVGGSLQFFIYDTLKITILLCVLIFGISYIQSYFPPERSRRILGRFHGIGASTVAALLGTVTPFCSCSSVPIFLGFTSAGLPLGTTFAFLISSPMVDLASLMLLMSIFGAQVAVLYAVFGLVVAIVGGAIIDRMRLEDQVRITVSGAVAAEEGQELSQRDRLTFAAGEMRSTFKKVFPYILIGVGVGALIHNWIPAGLVQRVLGGDNPFGVLLATVVAAPIYADIFGTIPIAEALLAKGALLGTTLAFMMSVTTVSLPEFVMISKAIKPKLFAAFLGICLAGIIAVGYLFNAISPMLV